MKAFFAAILAFFMSIFGGVKSPAKPVDPDVETPTESIVESASDSYLEVGDTLTVSVEGNIQVEARLIETNGALLTVEISIQANPGLSVIIMNDNEVYNVRVPDSGKAVTVITTDSTELSVAPF